MSRPLPLVIAGAGIGGLGLALQLAARGRRAIVLEQAERLTEVGAGIQLSPNATRLLHDLGLAEGLERVAVRPTRISLRLAGSGREITSIPLGADLAARHGAPYLVVHRADLQQLLHERAQESANIEIRLGTTVTGAETTGTTEKDETGKGTVTVSALAGARSLEIVGAGLVGADGVWSRIRRDHLGGPEPSYSGRTAWRATFPADALPPDIDGSATGLWLGANAHLVHYPVAAGRSVNIVAIVEEPDWREERWSAPGERQWLRARFAAWAPLARRLIDIPDRWLKWALCGVDPDFPWSRGPVTLLGDAAHAMLPFLAQGGAMAIEDGRVLADRIAAGHEPFESVFRDYERIRKPRVRRVARTAAANGRSYHLAGAAALARNMVLAASPPAALISRYDWLYGWKP